MTTREIIAQDRKTLREVENSIIALSEDKRPKSQTLLRKFIELRECLKTSIEDNECVLHIANRW